MNLSLREPKLLYYSSVTIALLLFLSLFLLARDLVAVLTTKGKPAGKPTKAAGQVYSMKSLDEYGPLLKDNPFGIQGGELKPITGSPQAPGPESMPPPIDVSLVGIVYGPSPFDYAIFSDKAGSQEVFAVGDSVFGLGKLGAVKKDRVLLIQRGRRVEILLLEPTSTKELAGASAGGQGEPPNVIQATGGESSLVDQKMLQSAIDNPKKIMTDARLLPYIVEGQVQGFVLSEVARGGVYQTLGLQNGDVLMRINEHEISAPESALQAFVALKGMDLVQLDILRNGTPMTLSYQIQ
jgi:type II secretion system protein C